MIQANELRIDNYILYDNTICTIEMTNSADIVYVRSLDSEQKDISTETIADRIHPVPLTEDALLKCGFEYILPYDKKDNWEMKLGNYKDSEYTPKLDGTDVFPVFCSSSDLIKDGMGVHIAICEDSGSYLANLHGKDILYLHQLQNLYFALTGKELEVKL